MSGIKGMLIAGVSGVTLLGANGFAAYSFNEPFSPPAITAGNPDFYEDGFLNGDNGWSLIEQGSVSGGNGVGGTNFGQRPMTFWPHNDDDQVTQVRVRSGLAEAYAIRNLPTGLVSGNVSMTLMGYATLGDISYSLRLANADGTINALQLDFGTEQTGSQKFRASQSGYASVVVADDSTTTTGGAPLLWNTAFSTTAGDYAILSVDFDTISDLASVMITTVDANGVHRSTAPVSLALDPSVTDVSRVSLNANDVSTINGSLSYVGNFSITGQEIPEPASVGLLGFAALAMARRRRK